MKLIGLVGGTTWLSTIDYYRHLNQMVSRRLGGLHSARVLLHSVDFAELIALGGAGDTTGEARVLAAAAQSVERGGAGLLALCANTAHIHADAVRSAVGIPLVHIVDAVKEELARLGVSRVGVLSTGRSRAAGIFDDVSPSQNGGQVLMPTGSAQERLDHAIHDGASKGGFGAAHADVALEAVAELQSQGAQLIVLGCTELALMLAGQTPTLPCLDSAEVHARAIVEAAFGGADGAG